MHWDWSALLSVVVAIAAAVIRHSIVKPKDHELASQIRHIADDVAATIVTSAPKAAWAAQLAAIISALEAMLPDLNADVRERAATGALARLNLVVATPTTSEEPPTP